MAAVSLSSSLQIALKHVELTGELSPQRFCAEAVAAIGEKTLNSIPVVTVEGLYKITSAPFCSSKANPLAMPSSAVKGKDSFGRVFIAVRVAEVSIYRLESAKVIFVFERFYNHPKTYYGESGEVLMPSLQFSSDHTLKTMSYMEKGNWEKLAHLLHGDVIEDCFDDHMGKGAWLHL
jgi:hypothetical protein